MDQWDNEGGAVPSTDEPGLIVSQSRATIERLKSEVIRQEGLVQQALRDRDAWKATANTYLQAMRDADLALGRARGHLVVSVAPPFDSGYS